MKRGREKPKEEIKEGIEACTAYLKDVPLSARDKDALMNACVKDWLAMPPEKRLEIQVQCAAQVKDPSAAKSCEGFKALNPETPLGVFLQSELKQLITCEQGKLEAPDLATKQEFAEWCLAQIQPSLTQPTIAPAVSKEEEEGSPQETTLKIGPMVFPVRLLRKMGLALTPLETRKVRGWLAGSTAEVELDLPLEKGFLILQDAQGLLKTSKLIQGGPCYTDPIPCMRKALAEGFQVIGAFHIHPNPTHSAMPGAEDFRAAAHLESAFGCKIKILIVGGYSLGHPIFNFLILRDGITWDEFLQSPILESLNAMGPLPSYRYSIEVDGVRERYYVYQEDSHCASDNAKKEMCAPFFHIITVSPDEWMAPEKSEDSSGALPKADTKTALILSLLLESAKRKVPYTLDEVAELSESHSQEEIPEFWDDSTEVVPRKIHLYNHLMEVKNELSKLKLEYSATYSKLPPLYLSRQIIEAFPRMVLLYPDPRRREIIIIDPIGRDVEREQLQYLQDYRTYFIPDYAHLIKNFVAQVENRENFSLDDFSIKVIISHSHTDHWAGLGLLHSALPDANLEILLHPQVYQDIVECVWPARDVAELLSFFESHFTENISTVLKLFYGNCLSYRDLLQNLKIKFLVEKTPEQTEARLEPSPIPWQQLFVSDPSGKNIEVIPTKGIEWAYPRHLHGSSVVIFKYTSENGDKTIFLNDLFPLRPALSTSVSDYPSFLSFFTALKQENPFNIIGSHFYPLAQFLKTALPTNEFLYTPPLQDFESLRKRIRSICNSLKSYTIRDVFSGYLQGQHSILSNFERLLTIFIENEELKRDYLYDSTHRDTLEKEITRLYPNLTPFLRSGILNAYYNVVNSDGSPRTISNSHQYVVNIDGTETDLTYFRIIAKYYIFTFNVLRNCLSI